VLCSKVASRALRALLKVMFLKTLSQMQHSQLDCSHVNSRVVVAKTPAGMTMYGDGIVAFGESKWVPHERN
jgi:hypothetical protein